MTFESVFVDPRGRTPRAAFIPALIVLVAAGAFFHFLVTGRTAEWCVVMLIYPGLVLHARRLHDMGQTAWLLVAPGAMAIATAWLQLYGEGSALTAPVTLATQIVCAGFALWGIAGKGAAGANRFGKPVPA